MSKPFINYEYIHPDDTASVRQYDDIDFSNHIGVEARYVRKETDAGNPFIEALPRPREPNEISLAGSKGIVGFCHEIEKKKSRLDQFLSVMQLRNVRFPLPMNYDMENVVYLALVTSYRARHMLRDKSGDVQLPYEAENRTQFADGILIGNDASAANAGITLLGYSGCGKSSALETVFSNYPQYIIHRGEGLTTYPQIVYLVVQCPPHSNFRGLYKNIGVAIDRALGNVKPIYALELDAGNHGSLSKYTDMVRRLIEQFSIGMIVFDEIQHLNFDTSLENSFESILELTNQTKVAFGVVGTEDAYDKIFAGNLRQTRRLGPEIHADRYCSNKLLFTHIVTKLFTYQWFDHLVTPTQAMIDAMYECTHGIIDQVIGLYMFMNIDYLNAGKKPTVDEAYIFKTAKRHYPSMLNLIGDMETSDSEQLRAEQTKAALNEIYDIIRAEQEKVAETTAADALGDGFLNQLIKIKQEIVRRIMDVDDSYNSGTIERVCDQVLSTDTGKQLASEKCTTKLAQLVNKRLKSQGKTNLRRSPKKQPSPSPAVIRSFLDDSIPDAG